MEIETERRDYSETEGEKIDNGGLGGLELERPGSLWLCSIMRDNSFLFGARSSRKSSL